MIVKSTQSVFGTLQLDSTQKPAKNPSRTELIGKISAARTIKIAKCKCDTAKIEVFKRQKSYFFFIFFLKIVGVLTACNRENHPKIFCAGATTIRYARVVF